MAKRRLADIAAEHDMSFEQVRDLAFNILDECALTGKGKNTWVNEVGQDLLDDNIEMLIKKPKVYRGRIRNIAPNPRFAFVHVKEKSGCVKMEIPRKYIRYMKKNGMVYLEEHKEGDEEETYIMVVPKIV
jgi:hypothetical protein